MLSCWLLIKKNLELELFAADAVVWMLKNTGVESDKEWPSVAYSHN